MLRAQCRPVREDHDARAEALRLREEQPGPRHERAVGLHPVTAGIEVTASDDALGPERTDDGVPADARHRLLDFDDDVLKVIFLRTVVPQEAKPRDAAQMLAVELMVGAVRGNELA